jgi:hypothetical protein
MKILLSFLSIILFLSTTTCHGQQVVLKKDTNHTTIKVSSGVTVEVTPDTANIVVGGGMAWNFVITTKKFSTPYQLEITTQMPEGVFPGAQKVVVTRAITVTNPRQTERLVLGREFRIILKSKIQTE